MNSVELRQIGNQPRDGERVTELAARLMMLRHRDRITCTWPLSTGFIIGDDGSTRRIELYLIAPLLENMRLYATS